MQLFIYLISCPHWFFCISCTYLLMVFLKSHYSFLDFNKSSLLRLCQVSLVAVDESGQQFFNTVMTCDCSYTFISFLSWFFFCSIPLAHSSWISHYGFLNLCVHKTNCVHCLSVFRNLLSYASMEWSTVMYFFDMVLLMCLIVCPSWYLKFCVFTCT